MANAPGPYGDAAADHADSDQSSFRHWRRTRPFWGGLLLILSGLELLVSGNLDFTALQLHVGPTGFLSYVIPLVVLMCGVLVWLSPGQRLFYGILGSLVAVYSLIGVNLGGFFIGLLLGIVGGALTIAWSPSAGGDVDVAPGPYGAAPADRATDDASPGWFLDEHGDDATARQPRYDQTSRGGAGYGNGAYHEASAPREVAEPERWWGGRHGARPRDDEQPPPPHGGGGGEYRGRLLAITLVPVTLAAALLFAVERSVPAYADPCPLPGASASASTSATPSTGAGTAGSRRGTPNGGATPGSGGAGTGKGAAATPGPSASGVPSGNSGPAQSGSGQSGAQTGPARGPSNTGNPLVDGWNNFWNGVFGIGHNAGQPAPGQPTPTPSGSPSATPSTGTGTAPGKGPGSGAGTGSPAGGTPGRSEPSASASASPSPSGSTLPCLGGGVIRSAAVDPGQPPAAATQGTLTGTRLVMNASKFEGVAELPTAAGTIKVLKFTMDSSVTTNFQLSVAEPNGKKSVIRSPQLTTSGHVEFYTPSFSGKLLGLIPLTFTPTSLPPPTFGLPLLFTDVTISLAYVRCDVLTALPAGAPAGTGIHLDEE